MTFTALQTSWQALQGFARPGAFARDAFLLQATSYQNELEDLGVPAGYLTPTLDLFSDPRADLDHTAAQAFLENAAGAGLLVTSQESLEEARARFQNLNRGRLTLDAKRTLELLDDETRVHELAPTYQLFRPLSGLSIDNAAEVWLAHDQIDKRTVAVKGFRSFALRGDMPLGGILNELRFQSHPSGDLIVKVFHGGRLRSGDPYLAMEWMEGGSLRDALDRRQFSAIGAFFQSAVLLMKQMVEAVAWTHQHGILHRDVQPANFFLAKDLKKVKLGDFGTAIREEEIGLYASRAGTAVYMPPEFSGESDPRDDYSWDVYSLGLTLFEFLTGLPAHRIRSATQAVPSQLAPQRRIPGNADAIILKAMHSSPSQRYENAVSMMEDIERFF